MTPAEMAAPAGTLEQQAERLRAVLETEAGAQFGPGTQIRHLQKMSAGASRETWAFEATTPAGERLPLILKRDPMRADKPEGAAGVDSVLGVDRWTEGRLMQLAREAGVPEPRVHFFLKADERTSAGFVMDRVDGETLGRRIARDDAFAGARMKLAYQCGEAAARLHAVPTAELPPLKDLPPRPHLQLYRDTLDSFGHPHAGFEYGLRWLEERIELAGGRHTLVHGDFRNGNLIVGPDGLRAVLDWELGHLGDPMCDLGWICVKSWRYGHVNHPVGGFGAREDMFAGYEAAGGIAVDPAVVHFWEVFGAMRWGIMCMIFAFGHLTGRQRSVEAATIGRRAAEAEYDLLELVD
jgi:aminoglycoside phosphotransferase (APT) family kinase protein